MAVDCPSANQRAYRQYFLVHDFLGVAVVLASFLVRSLLIRALVYDDVLAKLEIRSSLDEEIEVT